MSLLTQFKDIRGPNNKYKRVIKYTLWKGVGIFRVETCDSVLSQYFKIVYLLYIIWADQPLSNGHYQLYHLRSATTAPQYFYLTKSNILSSGLVYKTPPDPSNNSR